jgi:adenylate cyclase
VADRSVNRPDDGREEGSSNGTASLSEAAQQAGVSAETLRRWSRSDVIPEHDGEAGWTPAAIAHARIVVRLRERGHTLEQIRRAGADGRLAYGFLEEIFPRDDGECSLEEAAEETGLEPALIERLWTSLGFPRQDLERFSDEDLRALRYIASVLDAGFPLVAFLQLTRVYGQALSRIAEAEARLFHSYVHEPLMSEGVPSLQMAEEMDELARDLLPLASPIMDYVHQRSLQRFVEGDVIGHMEAELDGDAGLGRVRVAVAFVDLAGYTRFIEEEGEEEALSRVERFIDAVNESLPEDAALVKTIGDEAMVVGRDVRALLDWAVGFEALLSERPAPRIGMHSGMAIYRDGDYFGRDVNLAARVVARSRGGEVIVTDAVREVVEKADHLAFEDIGTVKLKGFGDPERLSRVTQA